MAQLEERLTAAERTDGVAIPVRPTYVDPSLCTVVAFVNDSKARTVVAAGVIKLHVSK